MNRRESIGGAAATLSAVLLLAACASAADGAFTRTSVPSTESPCPIVLDAKYDAKRMVTLGTAGLRPVDGNPGSHMFIAVAEPGTRRGVVCGWLTSEKASGVIFTSATSDGRVEIRPVLQGGKSASEREILVFGEFDDCRRGLEAYADEVARHYAISLPPQISGYCTWYADRFGGAGSAQSTREFAELAGRVLKPWGFDFFQIDDRWQAGKCFGGPAKVFMEHNPRGPYPDGMAPTAADLAAKGIRPGLWFMPFAAADDAFFADKKDWFLRYAHSEEKPRRGLVGTPASNACVRTMWGGICFDTSHPGYRKFLREEVTRLSKEWGYRYFKYDGMYMGAGLPNTYVHNGYKEDGFENRAFHDPAETAMGAYRAGVRILREAAGKDVFVLACNLSQNIRTMGASYGLVDACRIGPDNSPRWNGICAGPVCGSARYFYNGRVWYNDPDPVYVRDAIPLAHARTIASWVAISGGLYAFSDWLPDLSPERIEVLRRTMAPHRRYRAVRPIDLFESKLANAWLLDGGERKVLGLFSWSAKSPLKIDYAAAYAGLDPEKTYAAFDFWENRFLEPIRGRVAAELPPASCRVVQLAELRDDRPALVSTSRHVASPVFEVRSCEWDEAHGVFSGVSDVVGGERYELRFVMPEGWSCKEGVAEGRNVRVTFEPTAAGAFAWSVRFGRGGAPCGLPADRDGLKQRKAERREYSWRGYMLDVSRHFFTVAEIKRTLDAMAMVGLNVFHWHLTDNEGWRLQIDRYPELTRAGAVRATRKGPSRCFYDVAETPDYGPYFYTKAEVREVIAYARERGIRVVPEIEIPGHSTAAVRAYRQLGCKGLPNVGEYCLGSDEAIAMLEGILDEVCELFPDEVVHIGGDECGMSNWPKCERCLKRVKDEGLADAKSALQGWATAHFARYLEKKGKRMMGWDEVARFDLPKSAIVMSYRGRSGGIAAAKRGYDVVMTPTGSCYLDYSQGLADDPVDYQPFGSVVDILGCGRFDPEQGVPAEVRRHILGGQGSCWTEIAPTIDVVEWRSWPRMAALAKAMKDGPFRDEEAFLADMKETCGKLRAMGMNPAPVGPLLPPHPTLAPAPKSVKWRSSFGKLLVKELTAEVFDWTGKGNSYHSIPAKIDPSLPKGSFTLVLGWRNSRLTASDKGVADKALEVLKQVAIFRSRRGLYEYPACEISY